jgi:hypothetical protein
MSKLTALLVDLQAAASAQLSAAGQPAQHKVIINGNLAWDFLCGGYLYVRYASASGVGGNGTCAVPFVDHSIYVGVLRCIETVDDAGNAPSTETMTEEALTAVLDSEAVYRAITCDIDWSAYDKQRTIVGWTALDGAGGMMGGEWQIMVRFLG